MSTNLISHKHMKPPRLLKRYYGYVSSNLRILKILVSSLSNDIGFCNPLNCWLLDDFHRFPGLKSLCHPRCFARCFQPGNVVHWRPVICSTTRPTFSSEFFKLTLTVFELILLLKYIHL